MHPVTKGHDYIIPTEQCRIHCEPWLVQMAIYGVSLDMIINAAVRTIIGDGKDHCGDLISYLTEAIQHNFEMTPEGTGNLEALHALQSESDRMIDIACTSVDILVTFLRPYIFEIEKLEANKGVDTARMDWVTQRVDFKDVLLTIVPRALNDTSLSTF